MDVLWREGELSVQEVRDRIGRDLAYTTVMTTLNVLATKKKVVTRKRRGRAFSYRPRVSREDVSRSVISNLQPVLFGSNTPSLVLQMISTQDISREDVQLLKQAIASLESDMAGKS